ncbi:MAG: FKBP-type peptidyl-prolyl cis-trans isomerase [Victivallaceae bacterium]|nr:FKBP-type peptidyl-prolyl cis-trans isomerase [Victivallaceae bacterium]
MDIKTEVEKSSYALGVNMGQSIQQFPFELDKAALVHGFSDMVNGAGLKIDQEEYGKLMHALQTKMQEAQQSQNDAMKDVMAKNKTSQQEFIAKNAEEDGIKTTASGMQYQVMTDGAGATPTKEDTVRVHYTGTLLDGTVFDSSVERGQPAEFGVGQVIAGWTEALQDMKVGSKHKLFIPSELAYGDRGAGQHIEPGSMLIFEVELLAIL